MPDSRTTKATASRRKPPSPKPADITSQRKRAGLTKTAAGALLHANYRTWQQWESGERKMHPAFWELFVIKSGV